MKPKTIAILVVALLFVIILFINSEETEVQFLIGSIRMPLFALIVSNIILGWIVGWFSHVAFARGRKSTKPARLDDIEKGTVTQENKKST